MSVTMDPVASVNKLWTSIAQLSVRVDKFANQVHDAKEDMEDLSEKLASLEECLEILVADFGNPLVQYPDRQKKPLKRMIDDCDRITKEMITLLKSLSADRGQVSWSGFSKETLASLLDSLEADRSGIVVVIGMKQLSDAEQNRLNRAANSDQDTESMLSVRQSFLETAHVPYAKEDPYPKPVKPPLQVLERRQTPIAAPVSRPDVPSSLGREPGREHGQEQGRSGMHMNSSPFTESPIEVRSNDQQTESFDRRKNSAVESNDVSKSSPNFWSENQFTSQIPPLVQNVTTTKSPDSYRIPDDWTNRQLIVTPLEQTGEGKEVVPSSFSVRSGRTIGSMSEMSARNSTYLPLEDGKLDQIAIAAAAKARNRLSDSEQRKADKELLKRIKDGAEMSKIQPLLDRGADPNASGPRNTVLTTEIQYSGRQQVIGLLLSRGAEPNASSDGIPKYKIIEDGNMERLRSRMGAGRSIDAVPYQVGILFLAALHTNIDIVKLLVSYGARLKPYSNSASEGRSFSPENRPTLDRRNSSTSQPGSHRSAILAAAEAKKWDIVHFLVLYGADPNDIGEKAGSTLQLATASNKKDLMQLLIEGGADVNTQGGQYGAALIAAAYEGHPTAAKILLDAGANINLQSRKLGTALNAAVLNGYSNVVKLLLERGADTKINYVLDTALQRLKDDPENTNRKAIVRQLEARGAKSGPVDKKVPEWAGLFSDTY
jgi:ankyrin repeat protein